MATQLKKYLGTGLYTVREASLDARVSPEMMNRWLFGTGRRDVSSEDETSM